MIQLAWICPLCQTKYDAFYEQPDSYGYTVFNLGHYLYYKIGRKKYTLVPETTRCRECNERVEERVQSVAEDIQKKKEKIRKEVEADIRREAESLV